MREDVPVKVGDPADDALSRKRTAGRAATAGQRGAALRSPGHLSVRVFWASVVAAITPILVAAVRGCLHDWNLVSDNGLVAIRSFDVLTRHPPLLGMWSSASVWSRVQVNLPGPLEFELLAVPVHVLGARVGTAIGMAIMNAAAIVVTAVLARRRGGPLLAMGAMLFVVSLEWSMGSEFLYDPWPINSAPFVFVLFLFACWSVADGDLVVLPAMVFCASYLVQTHLSYVILVPVVGALAVAGLALVLRSRRLDDVDGWPLLRRRSVIALAASAVFTLFLWAPPIYQQLTHHPGNFTQLAKASRAKPPRAPNASAVVRVVGSTVALPPWWLPGSYGAPKFDLGGNGPSVPVAGTGIALLTAAGVAMARLAMRRRDWTSTTALALAGGALLAGLATVYKSPSPFGYDANYLRWLWPTSMFCWFAIVNAAVRLTNHTLVALRRPPFAVALLAAVVVVSALALPEVDNGVFARAAGPIADDLAKRALPQIGDASPVLFEFEPVGLPGNVAPMILVELQRRKIDFVVNDTALVHQLGDARRWNGHNASLTLRVDSDPAPQQGFRRISSYVGLSRSEQRELRDLEVEVRRWLTRAGKFRLSALGQRAVVGTDARSQFFRQVFENLTSLRGGPAGLLSNDASAGILSVVINDHGERGLLVRTDPLGDRKVARWAHLRGRLKNERVSVDLAPIRSPGP